MLYDLVYNHVIKPEDNWVWWVMCILLLSQSKLALLQEGEDFIVFSVLKEIPFLCGGTDLKVTMPWPNFSCSLHLVYYYT